MIYQNFFGLKETPFNLTPDPRFFFCSKKHEEALSHVLFGVKERKGFIVITGEVGTGKTTLCRLLLQRLDPTVKTSLLFNANMGTIELLQAVNQDFGLPGKGETKKALVDELNRFLLDTLLRGENALLIIDEAQNLSIEAMEEIRLLSNLETEREKLIQILLIGQPELRKKLALDSLRQLNQRITLRYDIPPLDYPETQKYLEARLSVAGGQNRITWMPEAVEAIYRFSGGVPRLTNVAADRALLAAYVAESRTISARIVSDGLIEMSGGVPEAAPNARNPRRRSGRLVLAALGLVLLIGGGYFLSAYSGFLRSSATAQAVGEVASPPSLSVQASEAAGIPEPSSPIEEKEAPKPVEVPAVSPIVSVKKPESAKAGGPALSKVEGFDPDGVFRVGSTEASHSAAYLTALKLWGRAPDIPASEVLSDPEAAHRLTEASGLSAYTIPLSLSRIALFDYPLVFQMTGNNPEGGGARWVVLSRLIGERAVILDPLSGKTTVRARELEGRWIGEGTLLWKRLNGIDEPFPDRGESVRRLQAVLADEGLLAIEKFDGVLGPMTRKAILFFQTRAGLPTEGNFNPETHLMLARWRANGAIPTLSSP